MLILSIFLLFVALSIFAQLESMEKGGLKPAKDHFSISGFIVGAVILIALFI